MLTATDSTESRFTAHVRGTGSSPGSRTTSLASPRSVVVHGAIMVRSSRGIAASRDKTTTGRRPMSGGSHHQTSPRRGWSFTGRPRHGTTPDHPTRRARRWGGSGTPRRRRHRSALPGPSPAVRQAPRRRARRLSPRDAPRGRWPVEGRQPSYSPALSACHHDGTNVPSGQRFVPGEPFR